MLCARGVNEVERKVRFGTQGQADRGQGQDQSRDRRSEVRDVQVEGDAAISEWAPDKP